MRQGRILDSHSDRPDLWPFVAEGLTESIPWVGDVTASSVESCGCGTSRGDENWSQSGHTEPIDDEGVSTSDEAGLVKHWQLGRKFAEFWPRGSDAPSDFPWLSSLVRREKAWRWLSQFPKRFANVQANDADYIRAFIAETLTQVEPDTGAEERTSSKTCCNKKSPAPPPGAPPEPPESDNGCEEDQAGFYSCYGCPPGQGKYTDVFADCSTMTHDTCVVTSDCPDSGPIDDDEVYEGLF